MGSSRIRQFLLAAACAASLLAPAPAAHSAQELRIGVLAKRGPEKALYKWQATADYLSSAIPGSRFRIVPMEFGEIPILVKNRLVDFVIVNSAIYVDLSVRYGVRRILTLNNRLSRERHLTRFGSVIFTRTGHGDLLRLADLAHKRVAAVHPTSLGGWIMAYRELVQAGVERDDFSELLFLDTHDAVVHAVLDGRADVGIVRTDTLERMEEEGRIELTGIRVLNRRRRSDFPLLVSTPLYPEWPLAEVVRANHGIAKRVAAALLDLPPDSPAAETANIHGWTIPENYQPVHEVLRALALSPYEDFNRVDLWTAVRSYWYWVLPTAVILLFLALLTLRVARLNDRLRRQARELEASEERFRATFEQAAVGIFHMTPDGHFLRFNQELCELSGYSELQLRQHNFNDLVHADDLPDVLARLERLRRGEIPFFSLDLRLLRPTRGQLRVSLTASCIRDDRGAIKFLAGVIHDVEDLHALEHQLHEQQARTRLILQMAGDGILGLDNAGRHTFVNPMAARLLGYEVDEMLAAESRSLWQDSPADDPGSPEKPCPVTAALRDGQTHRGYAETVWRRDGTPLQVDYVSTPILEGGTVQGAVVVFRPTDGHTEPAAE